MAVGLLVPADAGIQDVVAASADALGLSRVALPGGATHDAARSLARAGLHTHVSTACNPSNGTINVGLPQNT